MNEELKQLLGAEENLDEGALELRAADAQKFYNDHFKEKLRHLFLSQLVEFAEVGKTDDEIRTAQGVIQGIGIVDQWFTQQISLMKDKNVKDEPIEGTLENTPQVG